MCVYVCACIYIHLHIHIYPREELVRRFRKIRKRAILGIIVMVKTKKIRQIDNIQYVYIQKDHIHSERPYTYEDGVVFKYSPGANR